MKAYILEKPLKLEMVDINDEKPGDNEIEVKTMACGICGTDYHAYNGKHLSVKYPVIPGHELSGVVYKTGNNVKNFEVGDHVVVDPNITCGYCKYCREGKENFCENLRSIGINMPADMGNSSQCQKKLFIKFRAAWIL
ncbi:MAG: alcohol dehydrogenase catalytic domain-containing protein [Candidatus Micrarchaeaceae archaeon]